MKKQLGPLTAAFLVILTTTTTATIRYVDLNCTNATPPFTNWPTAATNIQDAVDAATDGDEVVVTNGVYTSGGRAVFGTMTNRVAIDRAVLVRSLSGPLVTFITGQPSPVTTTNGDGAIRCVYVGTNAVLSGFTLTNGHTLTSGFYYEKEQSGGGVWCEVSGAVTNCTITGNSALSGGGAYSGTLNNCVLTSNLATSGGGAYSCTLKNCALTANSAFWAGGGECWGTLNNCTLTGNLASYAGGGASGGTLNNCTLTGNSADYGGGASDDGTLNNCILNRNSALYGGGTFEGTLSNCTLTGNSAADEGGGAFEGTLVSCVLANNSANSGGGASESILNRCILTNNFTDGDGSAAYFSTLTGCIAMGNTPVEGLTASYSTLNNCTLAGNTWDHGVNECALNNCILSGENIFNYGNNDFNYCCTAPLPDHGTGNFTNAPVFVELAVGNLRLQSNSPCINAGNNAYVTTSTDLDGNPRIAGGTVDMGAYEFQGTGLSGFTGWLWQHGLRTDGTADYADSDGDAMNNWQEWVVDTNPTNALSVLQMLVPASTASGVTVSWQSVNTRSYFLERATNVGAQPPFQILQSNITGQAGTTSYTDTNAAGNGAYLYRVGVQQ